MQTGPVRSRTFPALAATVLLVVGAALAVPPDSAARAVEGGSASDRRIETARQAAAAGALDDAIAIYRDVLAEDPGNERAFWGLVRVYSSAGMEEELIPLLERRLEERPRDPQTILELGQAFARTGDHTRAHEVWKRYLELGPPDAGRYSDIGTMELRSRMYEEARETFLAGRAAFRSSSLFSQELTQVYTSLGDYEKAIDECFVTVESHGGAVAWAANRIEQMLDEGMGRDYLRRRMDAVVASDASSGVALSLAGSVFLALGRPERALESFLRADEAAGGSGSELFEYGAMLRDEGRSEEARRAFLMVVERHPGTSSAARAGVAAARIRAEGGDPEGGVRELRDVASAFDGSSVGAQALFESARVQLDVLGDADAALATVSELRERFGARARSLEDDAVLLEVDAYMKKGLFDDAHRKAEELAGASVRDDVREGGLFALGFASFLKHDYARALDEFRTMVETDPSGRLVNDALRLMLIIAHAQETGVVGPVDDLADAHAARIAGEDAVARRLLMEAADAAAGTALETEALLALGADAEREGDPGRAIAYYDRIISGAGAITAVAEAAMRKGDILAGELDRPEDAMETYLSVLEELPPNLLSGEARRKLDRLRKGEEAPE